MKFHWGMFLQDSLTCLQSQDTFLCHLLVWVLIRKGKPEFGKRNNDEEDGIGDIEKWFLPKLWDKFEKRKKHKPRPRTLSVCEKEGAELCGRRLLDVAQEDRMWAETAPSPWSLKNRRSGWSIGAERKLRIVCAAQETHLYKHFLLNCSGGWFCRALGKTKGW